MTELPAPEPGRFKPLRAGLVDLFLYDAQEFRFRDGRLLLRGDNGSGKSKVLALTLPLLLDADLSASRMEPDGDPKKRMEWNLLQDGEYEERTGYSWVEFGRLDESGEQRTVTLGLGLKAVQHRGVVRHWWFVTDRRVGEDLFLVDRLQTALTRDRLIEALGVRGTVYDTKERYRRAVDEALFSLHDRYDALVDLLVHLRQPQLSKRPDEALLARALSESLAPLSPALVDVVAESYQALDDDERELKRLREATEAVDRFTGEYRRYARAAVGRAAAGPRRAQSVYEAGNREANEAAAATSAAEAAVSGAQQQLETAEQSQARLEAHRDALRERLASDELRELDQARRDAQQTAGDARSAAAADARARTAAERADADAIDADAFRIEAETVAEETATRALQSATAAGAPFDLDELLDVADPEDRLARLGQDAERALSRRRRQLDDLARRSEARAAAVLAHRSAQERADGARARVQQERDEAERLDVVAAGVGNGWLDAVRAHVTTTAELGRGVASDELEKALAGAETWLADPGTQNPIAGWAASAFEVASAALHEQRAGAVDAARRLDAPMAELALEIEALVTGVLRRPAASSLRTASRDPATGAPFWELVDAREDAAERHLAGVEAALEAAGLLDAWVSHDGAVTAPDGDVLLLPEPHEGVTLESLLRPLPDAAVPAERVTALLATIAVVGDPRPGTTAVSTGGRFALGQLVGAATKPVAEYLGATARDRARRDRLEAARVERDTLRDDRARLMAEAERLAGRIRVLRDETRAIPDDREVRASCDRATTAARRIGAALERAETEQERLRNATEALGEADASVAEVVTEYAVEPGRLPEVREALIRLELLVREVVTAVRVRVRAASVATARRTAASVAAESASVAAADAARAVERSVAAAERLATLEATVGVEVRELEARLAAADADLEDVKQQLGRVRRDRAEAGERLAVARAALDAARAAVEGAAADRIAAAAAFHRFASTGLLRLAAPDVELPEGEWQPDPTVRLARRILDAVGDPVDDDAWNRSTSRLLLEFDALQAALSAQGTLVAREVRHDVVVVTVQHRGAVLPPDALAAELNEVLLDRERLLTEKERAILQTHLIDEVGAQLQTKVQAASLQVERMNRELDRRPTRSGLKLRIVWQPVDDEQGAAVRRLLQLSAAAWTPADRDAVGALLTDRIQAERAADPDGTWHERLTRAFDYRAWNRFQVQIHQNGSWRPASGPASGGERVLAASVPLFAAASSHYGSAGNPNAPRLILLDEAFAGVDDRSRANYLGLLAEFDLDVVMTSEREWATYPEVPGIGIAQLFRLPGAKAVHVDHWEWDGRQRTRVEEPGRTAVAPSVAVPDAATVAFDFDDALS